MHNIYVLFIMLLPIAVMWSLLSQRRITFHPEPGPARRNLNVFLILISTALSVLYSIAAHARNVGPWVDRDFSEGLNYNNITFVIYEHYLGFFKEIGAWIMHGIASFVEASAVQDPEMVMSFIEMDNMLRNPAFRSALLETIGYGITFLVIFSTILLAIHLVIDPIRMLAIPRVAKRYLPGNLKWTDEDVIRGKHLRGIETPKIVRPLMMKIYDDDTFGMPPYDISFVKIMRVLLFPAYMIQQAAKIACIQLVGPAFVLIIAPGIVEDPLLGLIFALCIALMHRCIMAVMMLRGEADPHSFPYVAYRDSYT